MERLRPRVKCSLHFIFRFPFSSAERYGVLTDVSVSGEQLYNRAAALLYDLFVGPYERLYDTSPTDFLNALGKVAKEQVDLGMASYV